MNETMPRTPFSTPLSGSARETEIRIRNIFSGPKKRPPSLFLALMFSVCVFCGNLVSCQMAEPDAPALPDISASLPEIPDISLPDPPEPKPEAKVWENQAGLEDIDLDGDGLPDTVTATIRFDPQAEDGIYNTLTVKAVLGSGAELEYHETGETGWVHFNVIEAGRITNPDRDALVLELEAFGSTYGASKVQILELDGGELTLALRGRVTGEQFGPHLIYDQIQVFDGDMMFNPNMLLQTITPEDIPADDRFPEKIFIADSPSWLWVQDINFDGAEDFAVLCDSTKSTGRRWFRWNEGQGRFEYAFSLAGTVEVVPQGQHLIEEYWDEYGEYVEYNIYGFNNRGWLILEGTWDTMVEAQNACKEAFQP